MTYDERELKQLYQAMREEDARRAPSFARSLRALPRHAQLGYLRAIAVATVFAIFALVMVVNSLRRRDLQPAVVVPPTVATHEALPAPVVASAGESPAPTKQKSVVPRRKPHAVPSISDWTSPTASLLDTPGDDLRTTVPSLQYRTASLSD